jgi:hypothetical protein
MQPRHDRCRPRSESSLPHRCNLCPERHASQVPYTLPLRSHSTASPGPLRSQGRLLLEAGASPVGLMSRALLTAAKAAPVGLRADSAVQLESELLRLGLLEVQVGALEQ